MTPETVIRYQSLLVALEALDGAGEAIEIGQCYSCGSPKIIGESGVIEYDIMEAKWVFDGIDGSTMTV